MCFKGQACQQAPHRGDRDGICGLMRHRLGSGAPSAEFGGDSGGGEDNSWNGGVVGEDKAAGSRGQVLIFSPHPPPPPQD